MPNQFLNIFHKITGIVYKELPYIYIHTVYVHEKNSQCNNKQRTTLTFNVIAALRMEWSGMEWSGVEWSGV